MFAMTSLGTRSGGSALNPRWNSFPLRSSALWCSAGREKQVYRCSQDRCT
jgi:hypothetical protein